MIEINDELIAKLEKLAMIKLSEEEKEIIKKDLNEILKYMEIIDEVDTSNVKPLFSPVENILKNVFHLDEEKSSEVIKNIIDEFPKKKENLLKVPGIQG
ncbi:Asp-tRNA(Asn)/Glu-tRNA(Gln) amidotransferase subunit GatC [Marinitoga litoralis]|uniref:Asp-tRNA(Asn)/Glu-tRNA(Gln) amidotransferase subunit GatC n=1 Tax=Marinitoga litoralis TaxID=570855 RepID=UPI0019621FBE|nr:Asp-tRNA(Asn)/Glu-tRNA(Gln) amidotransferase subunit GatC [Marinitoga litoralis]MBM7559150.1 aspartyl-tRNA(Asn)/glutamyl-tRNA(Gln) amidotransferase subunit C [Marinitoga litoralis]